MKVKDLIEALEQLDGDLPVVVSTSDYLGSMIPASTPRVDCARKAVDCNAWYSYDSHGIPADTEIVILN